MRLVLIVILLDPSAGVLQPVRLSATFRALRRPALLTLGIAALFYNFGFFSLLAYTRRSLSTRRRRPPASPPSAPTS